MFEKRHDAILRDIDNLECSQEFNLHNFVETSYTDSQGRQQRMFEITQDGFAFLAMGFTGKRAMNAQALKVLLSEQAKIDRARKARAAVVERNPVKKPDLEDTPTPKSDEPKERSRQQAARTLGVSERKVKQAQAVRKASPELATKVEHASWHGF